MEECTPRGPKNVQNVPDKFKSDLSNHTWMTKQNRELQGSRCRRPNWPIDGRKFGLAEPNSGLVNISNSKVELYAV